MAWTVYSPTDTKVRRFSIDGNLQRVEQLSFPIGAPAGYVEVDNFDGNVAAQQGVNGSPALQSGALPVIVKLPLQGEPTHFEKLLAVDEPLEVSFGYRGLRKS